MRGKIGIKKRAKNAYIEIRDHIICRMQKEELDSKRIIIIKAIYFKGKSLFVLAHSIPWDEGPLVEIIGATKIFLDGRLLGRWKDFK